MDMDTAPVALAEGVAYVPQQSQTAFVLCAGKKFLNFKF